MEFPRALIAASHAHKIRALMMVRVRSGVENVEFPKTHDRALSIWGRE